jgi:hypothetical protein
LSVAYKNNIVKKVENTLDVETDPEYIDFTIGFSQLFFARFNEIEGIEATVEKNSKKPNIYKIVSQKFPFKAKKSVFLRL